MLAMVTRPGSWELIKSLLPSPAKRGDPQISKIGFNFPDMACDACNQVRDLLLDPTCWLQCIAICASMYQLFSILTWDTLGIPNLEQSWYSLFALCPRVFSVWINVGTSAGFAFPLGCSDAFSNHRHWTLLNLWSLESLWITTYHYNIYNIDS